MVRDIENDYNYKILLKFEGFIKKIFEFLDFMSFDMLDLRSFVKIASFSKCFDHENQHR